MENISNTSKQIAKMTIFSFPINISFYVLYIQRVYFINIIITKTHKFITKIQIFTFLFCINIFQPI